MKEYRFPLLWVALWVVCARFFGSAPSIAFSLLTFIYYLREGNNTKILLLFLSILIISDARIFWLTFGATAKTGFILLLLAHLFATHRSELTTWNNPIIRYFLPFIIYCCLQSVLSFDIVLSFQKALSYGLIFLISPLYVSLAEGEDPKKFYSDFLYFNMVAFAFGLFLYLLGSQAAFYHDRFRGVMGNPNALGIYITLLVPCIYYLAKNKLHYLSKPEFWSLIVLLVVSLAFTQSRNSMVSILIFLGLVQFGRLAPFLGIVVVLFLGIFERYIYLVAPAIISGLGLEEFFRIETLLDGSGRAVAWDFAWDNIQEHFFLGNGFDYTNHIFVENADYLSKLGHQGHAHNTYLTFWLDTGLVGLSLFIISFVSSIIALGRLSPYAFPMFYAILFSTNFESWLTASLNPFTIIFLLTFTLIYRNEQRKIEAQL